MCVGGGGEGGGGEGSLGLQEIGNIPFLASRMRSMSDS